MNIDTRQQIETALRAFSGADLRAASIGLLNTLGYQSEKTLDLDNSPDAFLAEFDKCDREFRKDKAMFERWKSIDFLFQITDEEIKPVMPKSQRQTPFLPSADFGLEPFLANTLPDVGAIPGLLPILALG